MFTGKSKKSARRRKKKISQGSSKQGKQVELVFLLGFALWSVFGGSLGYPRMPKSRIEL